MAYNKIITKDGSVLIDLTKDTITPDTLAVGRTAHAKNGEIVVGTMPAGIDTNDATASGGDILNGKTAYANGQKITGTIAFQPAKTITPGTASQTAVSSGYYTGGDITVKGDSNLVAENIKNGTSIFGVTGTYEGSSGGDTGVEDGLITGTLTNITNDRVDKIRGYAFYSYSSLTTINFPACTGIGSAAFFCCYNLTTISFPACTEIGSHAFGNCKMLTTISLPKCAGIGSLAFNKCSSLTTISLPKCILIAGSAFHSCTSLISVYLMGSSLCKLNASNAFSLTGIWSNKGSIFVPASLVDAYKSATNWAYFSNRIFAGD